LMKSPLGVLNAVEHRLHTHTGLEALFKSEFNAGDTFGHARRAGFSKCRQIVSQTANREAKYNIGTAIHRFGANPPDAFEMRCGYQKQPIPRADEFMNCRDRSVEIEW